MRHLQPLLSLRRGRVCEGRTDHQGEGTKGHPLNNGLLCTKGLSNREYVYRKDRILTPLKRVGARGDGKFEEITWDEAYRTIADPAFGHPQGERG